MSKTLHSFGLMIIMFSACDIVSLSAVESSIVHKFRPDVSLRISGGMKLVLASNSITIGFSRSLTLITP